jgi:ankyrin repeat domain-containing protein 50
LLIEFYRFRWVACQLETLRSCKTLSSLETALKSLPKTLDATYDRILTSIDPENQLIARTALEWLCFSYRPLQLSELVEVVALKPRSYPLEFPDQLFEPEDLFSICSSLISTSKSARNSRTPVVQLAHYSVQEYLVSERIRRGPAKAFALDEGSSKSVMAEKCLTYLLGFRNPDSLYHGVGIDYPYLEYAEKYWIKQIESAFHNPDSIGSGLSDLVREFLNHSTHDAFLNSRRLRANSYPPLHFRGDKLQPYTLRDTREPIVFPYKRNSLGTPLSHAAENGAILLCKFLLENGADVNDSCGDWNKDRPPTLTAREGHINIVRPILDAHAVFFEDNDPPLAKAAGNGHDAIVQLLVEAGACINPPEGTSSLQVPLLAAARLGHHTTVETILRLGADIHWTDDFGKTALHTAACSYHPDCKELSREECGRKLMQIFLDGGLDINAESRDFGTPLTAAIDKSNETEVKLLLERGADAGMRTSIYGTPLELARREYHTRKKDTSSWRLEESKRIKKMLKDHLKARGEAVEDSDSDYDEPRKWWPTKLY